MNASFAQNIRMLKTWRNRVKTLGKYVDRFLVNTGGRTILHNILQVSIIIGNYADDIEESS